MQSQEIKALLEKHDSQVFSADTPTNVVLRESNRAVTRGSLLNALQTARLVEAVETLTEVLREALQSNVCDCGPSETVERAVEGTVKDLSGERVSIPK